ncbi:MAG: PKD domain-containing protein [Candidatus Bathyarchaeota archaeon]|jgi:hypothetical protein|nr:PKD domain-containing protein [Candidatus Bathyarchaeota archaeon]
MLTKSLVYIPILFLSLLVNNAILVCAAECQEMTGECYIRNNYLDSVSSQELVVDIFTEKVGRGWNVPIGTYRIGDSIKFFIFVSHNCTIRVDLIPPNGSIWVHMYGPVNNGTIIDYVDAQYPIGKWALTVKAQEGTASASDTAFFEVIDKEPYTYPRIRPPNLDNMTAMEEARFDGKVVNVYRYPVGYVHGWEILVDKVYFGPDIRNSTVRAQLIDIARSRDSPPGYLDYNITLGDQVEVYGLVTEKDGKDIFVELNGFENYYIKTLKTLYESPEIILFTREVFVRNLTVRIDGIAIPGNRSATISNVTWNWGDGKSSDQKFPATHTYTSPGNYIITIKAFQNSGLSTSKSLSISVPKNIIFEYTNTTTETTTSNLTRVETTTRTETSWTIPLVIITLTAVLASIIARAAKSKRLKELDERS